MNYQLENDIPLTKVTVGRKRIYPFWSMRPGDSFEAGYSAACSAKGLQARGLGWAFRSAKVIDRPGRVRIWCEQVPSNHQPEPNSTDYELQSDIDWTTYTTDRDKYPLRQMAPGQSFKVGTCAEIQSIRNLVYRLGTKDSGWSFTTRRSADGGYRVHCLATPYHASK